MVISAMAMLFVGLLVVNGLQTTAEATNLGTEGNATRTSLITNVHTAFTLLVLTPLIVGAGVVMRYFGWFG